MVTTTDIDHITLSLAKNKSQRSQLATGQKNTGLPVGNQMKESKGAGKPKEEWDRPILKEMLALKGKFKTKFGKDFGQQPKPTNKGKEPEQGKASEKNKQKRAAKAAVKAQKETEKAAK